MVESECEATDWLGEEAPDWEHDLSAAQSEETQKGDWLKGGSRQLIH